MPNPGLGLILRSNRITIPEGLIGYWPLDAAGLNFGASKAEDISGNGRTGTLNNLAITSLTNGKVREGLTFNGTSSYIDLGNSADLNMISGFTFAAWVLLNGATNERWIVGRDDDTLGRSFAFGVSSFVGGVWQLQINGGSSAVTSSVAATGTIYHAVATGDPTLGVVIYINGVSDGTGSWLTPNTSTGSTTIGERTYAGFQGYWDGWIDDVRIYNRAISAGEVVTLYRAGLAGQR
jgi:hypothetical protein